MTATTELDASRALAHINALSALRSPVVSRGCVIVHTPAATELYFKDAWSVEHAYSQELLHAMGMKAFCSFMERFEEILGDLRDGLADRTVLVTVDRRTDRVSEWWVGRRNDWSGGRIGSVSGGSGGAMTGPADAGSGRACWRSHRWYGPSQPSRAASAWHSHTAG